jgi:hypothetical protein
MTTFDTTGMDGGSHRESPPPAWGVEVPVPDTNGSEPFDSLALLRAAVTDQVEIEPVRIEVRESGVSLVCHTDITAKLLSKWRTAATPPALRNSPRPSPHAIDQLRFAVAVLVHTTLRIEVADPRTPGAWIVVEDARTGRPLTFEDRVVLDMFGAIDTVTGLRKLFGGREADLIKASNLVMTRAGWGEDEIAGSDTEDAELGFS